MVVAWPPLPSWCSICVWTLHPGLEPVRGWTRAWWDVSGFVPVGTTGTIDLGPYRPGRILRYDVYTAEFYLRTSTLYKHGKK